VHPLLSGLILPDQLPRPVRGSPPLDLTSDAFEILVDREEVLDFIEPVLRNILQVANPVEARIGGGHGKHLLVPPLLVAHEQYADGAHHDVASRECRFLHKHKNIQRIPITPTGVWNEAIIDGVSNRSKQDTAQTERACLRIVLNLVARAGRDLDDRLELGDAHSSSRAAL